MLVALKGEMQNLICPYNLLQYGAHIKSVLEHPIFNRTDNRAHKMINAYVFNKTGNVRVM